MLFILIKKHMINHLYIKYLIICKITNVIYYNLNLLYNQSASLILARIYIFANSFEYKLYSQNV